MGFKILLVNPPFGRGKGYSREGRCTQEAGFWATPWPPYSLAMLAAVLRKGNSVRILDCPARNISENKLSAVVARSAPDIVMASVGTETIESDLAALEKIKTLPFKPLIVIFGVHATVFAKDILENSAVDFVVRGEPEETARELVGALHNKLDPIEVKGIAGRSASGRIFMTPPRDVILDLDALPFPAWDLVDLDRYRLPGSKRRFILVNTLRGCPFPCVFCTARAYYGARARLRSVQSVLDEIEAGIARHGIRDVFFWSDTFTLVREQVKELCAGIAGRGMKFRWVANSRVDTVDPELLDLMKKAGCWLLSYGLESGDDRVLERSGKKITVAQVEQAVAWTRAAGIKSAGHFIFGLPGETEETAQKTIALARRLDLDFAQFYAAVPYPGSALFDEAVREGRIRDDSWRSFNQADFVMDLPGIARAALYRTRRKAYHAFYFRPRTLKTALSQASLRGPIASGARAVKKLFKKISLTWDDE